MGESFPNINTPTEEESSYGETISSMLTLAELGAADEKTTIQLLVDLLHELNQSKNRATYFDMVTPNSGYFITKNLSVIAEERLNKAFEQFTKEISSQS